MSLTALLLRATTRASLWLLLQMPGAITARVMGCVSVCVCAHVGRTQGKGQTWGIPQLGKRRAELGTLAHDACAKGSGAAPAWDSVWAATGPFALVETPELEQDSRILSIRSN